MLLRCRLAGDAELHGGAERAAQPVLPGYARAVWSRLFCDASVRARDVVVKYPPP